MVDFNELCDMVRNTEVSDDEIIDICKKQPEFYQVSDDTLTEYDGTILHLSIENQRVRLSRHLIYAMSKDDINFGDDRDKTPLHIAVYELCYEMIPGLVIAGADVKHTDCNNKSISDSFILSIQSCHVRNIKFNYNRVYNMMLLLTMLGFDLSKDEERSLDEIIKQIRAESVKNSNIVKKAYQAIKQLKKETLANTHGLDSQSKQESTGHGRVQHKELFSADDIFTMIEDRTIPDDVIENILLYHPRYFDLQAKTTHVQHSILHMAITRQRAVLALFIAKNVPNHRIDAVNGFNSTALRLSLRHILPEVAELLISKGASIAHVSKLDQGVVDAFVSKMTNDGFLKKIVLNDNLKKLLALFRLVLKCSPEEQFRNKLNYVLELIKNDNLDLAQQIENLFEQAVDECKKDGTLYRDPETEPQGISFNDSSDSEADIEERLLDVECADSETSDKTTSLQRQVEQLRRQLSTLTDELNRERNERRKLNLRLRKLESGHVDLSRGSSSTADISDDEQMAVGARNQREDSRQGRFFQPGRPY